MCLIDKREAEIVSDGSRHEPFCTVLLEQVSESVGVSKGQFARQTRRLTCPLGTGPTQKQTWLARRSGRLHKAALSNRLHSDKRHTVGAGPSGESPKAFRAQGFTLDSRCANRGEGMFLASKAAWAGIVFILTTGISGPRPTPLASGVNLSKEVPAAGHQNDIKKMQQTLRGKGHYRGKVDGVFGLRTRASLRGFQKAENLPITGQLDTQTAGKLGVRPQGREENGYETTKGKPSAGIKWAKGSGRTSKTLRKAVKAVAAAESGRGDREKTLQAENE
jgi:Putative peptidoglycan binding domain